ncbi:MAG: biotin synthase BioB [Spirochaetaceae bacterium]|jgi:biotin synthase|nr:biotin synthase BioB [Spirochaetaceae bacterium]
MNIQEIGEKALNREDITREEAFFALDTPDEKLGSLVEAAFNVRKKYKGLKVGIQLLTNARSGDCTQNCAYCAQSGASKADIKKYKLIPFNSVMEHGNLVKEKNLSRHCIGLSGIRFSDGEIEKFCEYVQKLKAASAGPICCSIGFLTRSQAIKLKNSGVNRINHNLNTSRAFYPNICTTHSYDERVENIKMLKETGFEICCGGIIGLGETKEDVIDMFFDIKKINPQSTPVNFLIPIKGSLMENARVDYLTPEYCLKVLSLARLMLPTQDIRCAAGREIYLKGREKELFSVADSIFASGYLTSGGQGVDETTALVTRNGFECSIEGEG